MECIFTYITITLPLKCVRSLWALTLSDDEWGGQFFPRIHNGRCVLSCDDVSLVKGIKISEHPDQEYYQGQSGVTNIASVPLYEEVISSYKMCGDTTQRVNMFFHTHPLLLSRDSDTLLAKFAPPSLGDIFAHCVLGNFFNFHRNHGQLNVSIIMAFEGLYMYSISPRKFSEITARIYELMQISSPSELLEITGEIPLGVIETLKMEIFDELRECHARYLDEQEAFLKVYAPYMDTAGAEEVNDSLWAQKGAVPERLNFMFAHQVGERYLTDFIRNNSLIRGLQKHGFSYEFYPAPFSQDLVILRAPSTGVFDE